MELDTVKSRMQDASRALQEADNWTVLSSDVDKVFESGDVKAVSATYRIKVRTLCYH